jgi:hypothetical protein
MHPRRSFRSVGVETIRNRDPAESSASYIPASSVAVPVAADGAPGTPGDLENDRGDGEADQRIGDRQAERHDGGRGDDGEAYVGIRAGMVAIGDQRRTVEAVARSGSDSSGYPVTAEADQPGGDQGEEVSGSLGVNQPRDRLDASNASRGEDRP